jgi:hypothetical protein
MDNSSAKKTAKQRKLSRSKQIEVLQSTWHEEAKQLVAERTRIGYGDFEWPAFIEIDPVGILDTSQQSQIIALKEQYKALTEKEELLWAEDKVIDELNKKHAIVHVEQTYVLTEKENPLGGHDFSLESKYSLKAYYEADVILCIDGIERSKADIWLKSLRRRKYQGITFDPTAVGHSKGHYNLWKGFTISPVQGDCSKYWKHVTENICNDDPKKYQYVRKWLACIFQHPDCIHTALVICGSQGVGKNSFVNPLGFLLGAHTPLLATFMSSLQTLTTILKMQF